MQSIEALAVCSPTHICGCPVEQTLIEGQSWRGIGVGGRPVVLKRIDSDCLIGSTLHPTVRDRLSRVRELANASVANLFGVERDETGVYLMWEFVEGETFDDYLQGDRSPREIALAARELALAVDLLHMQGIVHGALIGSNIFVRGGVVRLTHVSPLLYTDPAVDIECIWNLLDQAAEALGEQGLPLSTVAAEGRAAGDSLRALSSRLGTLIDTRDVRKSADAESHGSAPRRRALVGAALAAVGGLAIAWGVRHAIEVGRISPQADTSRATVANVIDR